MIDTSRSDGTTSSTLTISTITHSSCVIGLLVGDDAARATALRSVRVRDDHRQGAAMRPESGIAQLNVSEPIEGNRRASAFIVFRVWLECPALHGRQQTSRARSENRRNTFRRF